ncbi:MAG: class I SAM-dependent methyltransferase [Methylococcales bacterium]
MRSLLKMCLRKIFTADQLAYIRDKIYGSNIFLRLFSTKKTTNLQDKFSDIYLNNTFKGDESLSGVGSDLVQTATIQIELPKLIKDLNIKSFIDAPCGDWFWMKETSLEVDAYIGIDIVENLIANNNQQFGSASQKFLCLNIVEDKLPKADLIFCRDCLVHLTYDDIYKVITNFKRSQSRYLLTTTFIDRDKNVDLVGKDIWRTLNLQLEPFNFPQPLLLINENCTEVDGRYADKCLGLWRLDDLLVDKS